MSRLTQKPVAGLTKGLRAPSRLARSTVTSTTTGTATTSAAQHTEVRRSYATDNKPSFQGQMLESVSSRIAREKEERERFARQRVETAGTRRWATTFGESP